MHFNTCKTILKSRTSHVNEIIDSFSFCCHIRRGVLLAVASFKNAGKELCFNVGALFFCSFIHQQPLRRVHIVVMNCIDATQQRMTKIVNGILFLRFSITRALLKYSIVIIQWQKKRHITFVTLELLRDLFNRVEWREKKSTVRFANLWFILPLRAQLKHPEFCILARLRAQ